MNHHSFLRTFFATGIALTAFAANSVFCRLALGESSIDPASFTVIRLFSGAIMLLLILNLSGRKKPSRTKGSWGATAMLFLYATTFSFAYLSLDTGTGALILFGAVQFTMITYALISGDRLHRWEWVGVLLAFGGFVFLILPSVTTPSFIGFLLMTVSGIAWGAYTLMGRASQNPLPDTTYNFTRTLPLIAILGIIFISNAHLTPRGIALAIMSGALASGIGYTIWYIALGGLSATVASVAQLLVPVLAALGGVIFVSETLTLHFVLTATLILGGIALVVLGRNRIPQNPLAPVLTTTAENIGETSGE